MSESPSAEAGASAPLAIELRVRGRVQGVSFRWSTQKRAAELGLHGWVRNNADGTVGIHVEGPKEKVEALADWCRHGPPLASVSDVEREKSEVEGFDAFQIRR